MLKRQWILFSGLISLITFALSACSSKPDRQVGEIGAVTGFFGGVVVEEPRAALVARDTLSAGGTAADAVVAAYFTMVATYPVATSLGSGGGCLVYDPVEDRTRALKFLPRTGQAGGSIAIPTAVRAMALIHASYGRLRWSQLITPGERFARFGQAVSRALARKLAAEKDGILSDPTLSALLGKSGANGVKSVYGEGDRLVQLELAAALTQIRTKGVGTLYGGQLGQRYLAATAPLGGKLTIQDLRQYIPAWGKVEKFPSGNEQVYTLARSGKQKDLLSQALQKYIEQKSEFDNLQAFKSVSGMLPANAVNQSSGSTVVAIDRNGGAVACHFTFNGSLGLKKVTRDLGFLLAKPISATGTEPILTPVLVVNHNLSQTYLAAAASGGNAAISAMAHLISATMQRGSKLAPALVELRVSSHGNGTVFLQEELLASGFNHGLVQAIYCPGGARRSPATCAFATDPRGFGLASSSIN